MRKKDNEIEIVCLKKIGKKEIRTLTAEKDRKERKKEGKKERKKERIENRDDKKRIHEEKKKEGNLTSIKKRERKNLLMRRLNWKTKEKEKGKKETK